jgi:hypothetical protein
MFLKRKSVVANASKELGYATVFHRRGVNRKGVLVVAFEGTTWPIEELNGSIGIREGDRVRLVCRGSGPYCCKLFVEVV